VHERLDVLVNNAGMHDDALLAQMKWESWHGVLAVNLEVFFSRLPGGHAGDDIAAQRAHHQSRVVERAAGAAGADELRGGQGGRGGVDTIAGLGLDSVDALQIAVALEKNYRLKLSDVEVAGKMMQTVNTIAAAVQEHQSRSQ
jgi:acyl carrier protein